jgi:hypothetical protein
VLSVLWFYALILKVRAYVVTPELPELLATWISNNRPIGLSSITPQLRGGISDENSLEI